MYPAVAVGIAIAGLTLTNLFSQRQVFCRFIHSDDVRIISAAGYAEEPAHFAN